MIQVDLRNEDGTQVERRLTIAEISKIVEGNAGREVLYDENENYYKGNNPDIITNGTKPTATYTDETGSPDNRIAVPFPRKITITTQNYLFSRPISYSAEDKEYIEKLNTVFYINENNNENSIIGRELLVHDEAYEIFFAEKIGSEVIPRYEYVQAKSIIPVYSYNIDPVMDAAIRMYTKSSTYGGEPRDLVEVYYRDSVVVYDKSAGYTIISDNNHLFSYPHVPVVPYGSGFNIGIFDAVKRIQKAIDIIISADVNEIQKFEMAYLVLQGGQIDGDSLNEIRNKRTIEIPDPDSVLKYLTKELNNDFNESTIERLEKYIHQITGVPNFEDKQFSADAGIALEYKLIGFDNISNDIERVFVEGQKIRIDLINSVLFKSTNFDANQFFMQNPDKTINVQLQRNKPEDVAQKLEIAGKMRDLGVSLETVLENVPQITDVKQELERIKKEQEESNAAFESEIQELDSIEQDNDQE